MPMLLLMPACSGGAGPGESQGGGAGADEEAAAAQRMIDEDIDAILERAEVVDTGHVSGGHIESHDILAGMHSLLC
jgi:hypothetical protein